MTSFFQLKREDRWEITKDIRKNFKRICVDEPKAKLEEHDEEDVKRYREQLEDEKNLRSKRVKLYAEHDTIDAITSEDGLKALEVNFANDQKALHQALCDQIRVRVHVYNMKRSELPAIGADNIKEIPRLLKELGPEVKKPLPCKHSPGLHSTRPSHPAMSEHAANLHRVHLEKIRSETLEFMSLLNQGVFSAETKNAARKRARAMIPAAAVALPSPVLVPLAGACETDGVESESEGETLVNTLASPILLPLGPPRRIHRDDARLGGLSFIRTDAEYRVFEVDWHQGAGALVAWYYDVDEAASKKKSKLDFNNEYSKKNSHKDGKDFEVEGAFYAPVSEIREWINKSPHAMHVRPRSPL
jgi:hypothetical protein